MWGALAVLVRVIAAPASSPPLQWREIASWPLVSYAEIANQLAGDDMKIEAVLSKRSTVLSADVVGYSTMMAADATATLSALVAHFRRIESLVRQHGGRIVDAPGDNMLVEFPDEVRALLCAVQVQREIAAAPARAAGTPRMQFRIGLHSGESLQHHGRLYGDSVNIAARLQAAAEPNGILMSETVAERAGPCGYRALQELGPVRFKNIPYPVATYRPLL